MPSHGIMSLLPTFLSSTSLALSFARATGVNTGRRCGNVRQRRENTAARFLARTVYEERAQRVVLMSPSCAALFRGARSSRRAQGETSELIRLTVQEGAETSKESLKKRRRLEL